MSFDTEYDGIVIGAGHNGMILTGYLAKAGLKMVCFEQALEIGGGLDTHEDNFHPGFYHNVHSVFHRNVLNLPWYRDLELGKYGLEYIRPEITPAADDFFLYLTEAIREVSPGQLLPAPAVLCKNVVEVLLRYNKFSFKLIDPHVLILSFAALPIKSARDSTVSLSFLPFSIFDIAAGVWLKSEGVKFRSTNNLLYAGIAGCSLYS